MAKHRQAFVLTICKMMGRNGALGKIRTPDPQIRILVLYLNTNLELYLIKIFYCPASPSKSLNTKNNTGKSTAVKIPLKPIATAANTPASLFFDMALAVPIP